MRGWVISSIIHCLQALMVPPQHFAVEYSINPWMGGTVDAAKAMAQWKQLKSTLELNGVEVLTLDQVKGLPDMVFVCNSGLVAPGRRVYLSHFRHKERQGERAEYQKWFKSNSYDTTGDTADGHFEGGGDCVFSRRDLLWAGYGYRTAKEVGS